MRNTQSRMRGLVGLACWLGFLVGCFSVCAANELDLEYQCVADSPRGLKIPINEQATVGSIYSKAGIEVSVRPPPNDDCTEVNGGTPCCFQLASVNALINGGTSAEIDPSTGEPFIYTPLKQGRTPQTPADSWYAFGLAIPAVCEAGGEGAIILDTLLDQGDFECDQQSTGPKFQREDFLIFTRKINPNLYESPVTEALLKMEIHELAHVLNTHHAEWPLLDPVYKCFDEAGNECSFSASGGCNSCESKVVDYNFESGVTPHLVGHREDSEWTECVEPGSQGAPWCCYPEAGHMLPHSSTSVCSSLEEAIAFEDEQDDSSSPLVNVDEVAEVKISAEKKEGYIAGEPVRISVKIKDKFGFLFYPEEISLDPRLGYLRVWTTRGSESKGNEPGAYWPLSYLLHADANLDRVKFPGEASVSGIDTWFDRHEGPLRVPREGRRYWVQAAYSGLEYRQKDSGAGKELVVVSEPLLIEEEAPQNELFDPNALELFTKPEAKLFMFMLGGDHLGEGMKAMKVISQKYSKTIYAPYANLALGVNLSRPFYFFDGEREIKKRDPVPDQAGVYLEAALGRVEDLPPSYRRELYQALCDVEVMQGDQSGSPEEAGGHYDSALGYCESLLLLAPPISQTKEEADQDVKDQIKEIVGKRNNLG